MAELLEMPVIKIELRQATDLENATMQVLADRGVVLRSETAHIWALLACVAAIYVPIFLALLRRYVFTPRPSQASHAARGAQQPAVKPAPHPAPAANDSFQTINRHDGKPESDVQLFPDGSQLAGAFFRQAGDIGDLEVF